MLLGDPHRERVGRVPGPGQEESDAFGPYTTTGRDPISGRDAIGTFYKHEIFVALGLANLVPLDWWRDFGAPWGKTAADAFATTRVKGELFMRRKSLIVMVAILMGASLVFKWSAS